MCVAEDLLSGQHSLCFLKHCNDGIGLRVVCSWLGKTSCCYYQLSYGFMCNNCMHFLHALCYNNCRLSSMLENILEAKLLQLMTAFCGVT